MTRVALITGGARGIGLGIAHALAREGVALALNGVRPESDLAGVLDELRSLGADVLYVRGDVSVDADRHRLIDAVRDRFGRLDVHVNNAGITSPGRKDILEADEDAFDRVVGVNLKGPFFLTQLAARFMTASASHSEPEGVSPRSSPPATHAPGADATRLAAARKCIINVSSISGEFVSTNRGDYCLTKAATRMATKLWAARLAEFGIDVFEIQPGVIKSDMTAGVTDKYDRLIGEGLTLERRWGAPEDIGRVAAMLVRGDLPYATGQVLKIDGGMTIRVL
jgi:3-oxoacyl-[acyl-carrier protein] reductase